MASLVQSAKDMQQLVLAMTLGIVFFAVLKNAFSDRPITALPFLFIGMVIVSVALKGGELLDPFLGEFHKEKQTSKNHGFHVSPEAWKYVGLAAGVLVLFAIWYFIAKKAMAWYNSPAKVEARALRDSEAMQRIQRGLADNPDYQALSGWQKQLSKRQSPEARALMVEIDRLHEKLRSQEEAAALAPIAEDLAEIRFRNDPANREESAE
jgi:hypothetical protein